MNAIKYAHKILKKEGYTKWKIVKVKASPSLCLHQINEIWISEHDIDNIFMMIHEIAHIDFPDIRKGDVGHHRDWAQRYDDLLKKYIDWQPKI